MSEKTRIKVIDVDFDQKSIRTEDFAPSEADFLEANLEGIYDDASILGEETTEDNEIPKENVALYIESSKGKPCLLLNGYKYRKAYRSKFGTRWNCSKHKNCLAHLYLNDNDEITKCNEVHDHVKDNDIDIVDEVSAAEGTAALVITSRKGKEMLLYHSYTYRKQYMGMNRVRWVCSTEKNCKAFVFTNTDNFIISALEDHSHDPPKYYLKPDHVMGALAQPVIFETD